MHQQQKNHLNQQLHYREQQHPSPPIDGQTDSAENPSGIDVPERLEVHGFWHAEIVIV